jgi:hypothetical protein
VPFCIPKEAVVSIKRILCPARVRRIPRQFSWVDQRLVRDGIINRCGCDALALYLFLITVADAKGLSYYSDRAVTSRLSLDADRLFKARCELMDAGLIAFDRPIYQVLALDCPGPFIHHNRTPSHHTTGPVAIGEILRHALGGHDDCL